METLGNVLKQGDKVTVFGEKGTVVRVIVDKSKQIAGADVEVMGVIDRFAIDEIKKSDG